MQMITLSGHLPVVARAGLFDAWVVRLASEQFGFAQYGSGAVDGGLRGSYGDPAGAHFNVLVKDGVAVLETAEGISVDAVEGVLVEAASRVAAGDLGSTVVYTTELTVKTFDIMDAAQFMRMLGDQVHIEGARRLGGAVILDFPEGLLENAPLGGFFFAPETKVKATIFVDGPTESSFTKQIAAGVTEVTAALVAVAGGRPVEYFHPQFEAKPDEIRDALPRRYDQSILGLARDSVTLDIMDYLFSIGGEDAVLRARGSVLAYHAALTQKVPDVAIMLMVTSIEALIAVNRPWAKDKVTKRFISSMIELCPSTVDATLAHANVGEAFGFVPHGGTARQRKELVNEIYSVRSRPTHTGLGLTPAMMTGMAGAPMMRVALISDLARAALLAFIQAPRSSLVGHPAIDPPAAAE